MSCDNVCASCTRYNDDECLDTEGDHDISQEDVDRYLAESARRIALAELTWSYAEDTLRRVFGTKPIFDPQEG